MSDQRITRLVFCVEGVLLADDGSPVDAMPALLAELARTVELRAVATDPSRLPTLDAYRPSLSPEYMTIADTRDPSALFDSLILDRIMLPGHAIWIDQNPHRAMIAIRRGLDAALFEDAPRLYRDLGLWGLVPLIPDKVAARAYLRKAR